MLRGGTSRLLGAHRPVGGTTSLPLPTTSPSTSTSPTDGGSCKDYTGIKTGGWTFSGEGCNGTACPGSPAPLFGQPSGRTDVEGCCWWGRGVIQTTGTCNYGKLNFYMGKRAAEEGRPAAFPGIDFCRDPGSICAPGAPPELKWVAGFFYWLNAVQTYSSGGWMYIAKLKEWVDGGMNLADTGFIDGASGIVNRGCHNPPACNTGELHAGDKRAQNFRKVLAAMGLTGASLADSTPIAAGMKVQEHAFLEAPAMAGSGPVGAARLRGQTARRKWSLAGTTHGSAFLQRESRLQRVCGVSEDEYDVAEEEEPPVQTTEL